MRAANTVTIFVPRDSTALALGTAYTSQAAEHIAHGVQG